MTEQEKPRDPQPPLPPDFPRLHHPDLDVDATKDVEEPPNRDDVTPPNREDVKPELPNPEPPD
jgi:hypothetical protein